MIFVRSKSFYVFIISLFVSSCKVGIDGEIFDNGYCDIISLPAKSSNEKHLRNTSTTDEISFTVRTTTLEQTKTETHIRTLGPGEEVYIGCDYDAQGHKKYEIVGAQVNKK